LYTNPKEYQLENYMKHKIETEAKEQGGFFGSIKELTAGPKAWLETMTVKRTNMYIFSLYKVKGLNGSKKYLGILSTFFELPS
jgi:hypothetical protein